MQIRVLPHGDCLCWRVAPTDPIQISYSLGRNRTANAAQSVSVTSGPNLSYDHHSPKCGQSFDASDSASMGYTKGRNAASYSSWVSPQFIARPVAWLERSKSTSSTNA